MLKHHGFRFFYLPKLTRNSWRDCQRRWLSVSNHSQNRLTSSVTAPIQSYVSTIYDPFINLSIEHFLLQHSPPESVVLFLYRNRPCVVFGRNQNPWLELNLRECLRLQERGELDIVRRRSGGGTVFHDLGNVNWTVISSPKNFTRDKHAEMVVRALRSKDCGIERARVNERHDIVLDQGNTKMAEIGSDDMHRTPWTSANASTPLKCSGSAYKLTRNRALHHGTCLLNSKNLETISRLLRSPARGYIQAKGVESVSSPVGNTGVAYEVFVRAIQRTFASMYCDSAKTLQHSELGREALQESKIQFGVEEMRAKEWIYGQTPQFSYSIHPFVDAIENSGSHHNSESFGHTSLTLNLRCGEIVDASLNIDNETMNEDASKLTGESLYGSRQWNTIIKVGASHNPSELWSEWLRCLYHTLPIADHDSSSDQV